MKIYLTKINESWIIDRIKKEWIENNKERTSRTPYLSQIIWNIAPWTTNTSFLKKFQHKKIVQSIYHIENQSLDSIEMLEIINNDKYIDGYHVISLRTKEILKNITSKPIYYLPLWVNQDIWYFIDNKKKLRNKYGFNNKDFLVGSFQRDTEGSDLISPKLVKGPDIFIKLIKDLHKKNKNVVAVLTGKRRGYVISELETNNIPYKYFEMTNFPMMNELYNVLDLYLVTSRLEGGPQALVECGQTKTPILSTDVGIANQILDSESIFDFENIETFKNAVPNVEVAFKNSSKLTIPKGMLGYVEMFNNINEN
jgi:glycosyltransferase involved in cell wall biosynthesis